MQFGNFLFAESRVAERDGAIIAETIAEAELCDSLGFDVIWLAEHHFDGNCAYVDPVTFAAALAMRTKKAKIGFAVAQVSLHHPVRLAEQIALLDHLSHGRLIVGLGRGTAYNIYEYQGFGIDSGEAQARFEEAEEILTGIWRGGSYEHQGRFWQLRVPEMRPLPYSKPHPTMIHASATESSLMDLARRGLPFLMNVQSNETTRLRVESYRRVMREAGFDDSCIADALKQSWVWRNVFVAETDREAEEIALPAFEDMTAHRAAMRQRILLETGSTMPAAAKRAAHAMAQHSLVYGAPDTVAASIGEIAEMGVGGLLMQIRLGPMAHDLAARSLELFMAQVAPRFR